MVLKILASINLIVGTAAMVFAPESIWIERNLIIAFGLHMVAELSEIKEKLK